MVNGHNGKVPKVTKSAETTRVSLIANSLSLINTTPPCLKVRITTQFHMQIHSRTKFIHFTDLSVGGSISRITPV